MVSLHPYQYKVLKMKLILLIAAIVLFIFAACGFNPTPVSLIPLGLACWAASNLPWKE